MTHLTQELINSTYEQGAPHLPDSVRDFIENITVGHFTEIYQMDLSFWGVDEYHRSWLAAC